MSQKQYSADKRERKTQSGFKELGNGYIVGNHEVAGNTQQQN
jgi:hypothetical protein